AAGPARARGARGGAAARSSRESHRHRAHRPLPGGSRGPEGSPGCRPLTVDRRTGRGRGSAIALRGDGDPTRYYGASSLLAIIADGWKYIETTRPELYDLRNDPAEAVNLVAKEPARADALGRTLAAVLAAAGRAPGPAPQSAALDEEARQRLAALGYIGRGGDTSSQGFDRSKEDPKDLIGFFRQDQRLNKLVEEKKYAEARALCDD